MFFPLLTWFLQKAVVRVRESRTKIGRGQPIDPISPLSRAAFEDRPFPSRFFLPFLFTRPRFCPPLGPHPNADTTRYPFHSSSLSPLFLYSLNSRYFLFTSPFEDLVTSLVSGSRPDSTSPVGLIQRFFQEISSFSGTHQPLSFQPPHCAVLLPS